MRKRQRSLETRSRNCRFRLNQRFIMKKEPLQKLFWARWRGKKIDMIVAGALEKEAVLHPFLGNVARRLVREARCAVMLFTRPAIKPRPLRRIVFVADYSDQGLQALKRTLPFAAAESCERLYVIRIITTFDQARESIRVSAKGHEKPRAEDEEAAVEEFVLSAGATDVPVEARCVRGNNGCAVWHLV